MKLECVYPESQGRSKRQERYKRHQRVSDRVDFRHMVESLTLDRRKDEPAQRECLDPDCARRTRVWRGE